MKGKNPREIIEELEKIDDMEYNPVTPCPLNAKVVFTPVPFPCPPALPPSSCPPVPILTPCFQVMSEKRRKLAETWDRVIKIYEKENPDQYTDLKKLWVNYQGRKIEVVRYYESVMSAQVKTIKE